MFSSVNVNVEDGNLGRSTVEGRGVQVTIGVSNVKSTVPLLITNTMKPDVIKEKLGYELVGEYISEIALVDEENDIVAIATFMAKGKDTMEDTFSIQDLY